MDLLLAALSGLFYGFSFPPYNLRFLAWICFVPLLLVIQNPKSKNQNRFLLGFTTGFVANALIFSWLWQTFNAARINAPTTFLIWIALAALLALYFAAFAVALSLIENSWLKPWVAGALWVCLEGIRSRVLTGFPWALFSQTQAHHLSFLQLASVTGAAGLSFLLVAFNSALADCGLRIFDFGFKEINLFHKSKIANLKSTILKLCPVLFAVFLVHVWGAWRLAASKPLLEAAPTVTVAILQGNIDQYQKWDNTYEAEVRQRYEELALRAAKGKPDLILWPESAVPGWIPNEKFYVDWIRNIVRNTRCFNLVGAVSSRFGKDLNAAFLIAPDGSLGEEYDKHHLVPFGEYIPFGNFAKRWIPYLGQLGTFDAGTGSKIFVAGDLHLSPNICYEAVFPGLVRRSVIRGADVIVNLTNDGWFLATGAPEQHFDANILRAVENGRPVLRAANTGISAVIDPYGRVLSQSKLMEPAVLIQEFPVLQPPLSTAFLKGGSWFSWACLTLLAAALLVIKVTP